MRSLHQILFTSLLLVFAVAGIAQPYEKGGKINGKVNLTPLTETGLSYYPYERVLLRADALKMYAKSNGYDRKYAFIINMGMLSNTKRFFIVNLKSMCVESSGLVAHGKGDGLKFTGGRQYSNEEGSNCTSLGKYKIGNSYLGFFGLAFKLDGLEASNDNAMDRKIVLHSMHCIPESPGDKPICVSEGCPAVSDQFLLQIKEIIEQSKKPILLLIYDSTIPGSSIPFSATKKPVSVKR
jgi:hypothetical protein